MTLFASAALSSAVARAEDGPCAVAPTTTSSTAAPTTITITLRPRRPEIIAPESGSVLLGQRLQLIVDPPAAVISMTGPARIAGDQVQVTGTGVIVLQAIADGRASDRVWLVVESIANAPLGELPPTSPQTAQGSSPSSPSPFNGGTPASNPRPNGPDDPGFDGGPPVGSIDRSTVSTAGGHVAGGDYETGWHGERTKVHELPDGSLVFTGGMNIDADGAGSAWRADPCGQPQTSLRDAQGHSLDPTKTPYVVLPIGFEKEHPGVKLGDIVAVQYNGKTVFAIYGDRGPTNKIGEASILTAHLLGIPASPTGGGTSSGVTYTVFPGSGTGAPLSNAEIARRGQAALDKLQAPGDATRGMTGAITQKP